MADEDWETYSAEGEKDEMQEQQPPEHSTMKKEEPMIQYSADNSWSEEKEETHDNQNTVSFEIPKESTKQEENTFEYEQPAETERSYAQPTEPEESGPKLNWNGEVEEEPAKEEEFKEEEEDKSTPLPTSARKPETTTTTSSMAQPSSTSSVKSPFSFLPQRKEQRASVRMLGSVASLKSRFENSKRVVSGVFSSQNNTLKTNYSFSAAPTKSNSSNSVTKPLPTSEVKKSTYQQYPSVRVQHPNANSSSNNNLNKKPTVVVTSQPKPSVPPQRHKAQQRAMTLGKAFNSGPEPTKLTKPPKEVAI